MDITKIPTQELLDDKADAQADAEICELALLHGHKSYAGGRSIEERLETEKRIVEKIDAELERRKQEAELIDHALEIGSSR